MFHNIHKKISLTKKKQEVGGRGKQRPKPPEKPQGVGGRGKQRPKPPTEG
tara:strand:+ start:30801 stop:30950 length:150 start_codon:yes stop_codon:yes gene_type:complete